MSEQLDMVPGMGDAAEFLPRVGATIGYSRAIQILQQAWRMELMNDLRSSITADMACGRVCIWCGADSRTGSKVARKVPCGANTAKGGVVLSPEVE